MADHDLTLDDLERLYRGDRPVDDVADDESLASIAARLPPLVYESSFAVAVAPLDLFLERARKLSHDAVIECSGRARRSGVMWTQHPLNEWRQRLADLGIHVDENRVRLDNDLEVMAAHHPFGVLVIATVEVDPEVEP